MMAEDESLAEMNEEMETRGASARSNESAKTKAKAWAVKTKSTESSGYNSIASEDGLSNVDQDESKSTENVSTSTATISKNGVASNDGENRGADVKLPTVDEILSYSFPEPVASMLRAFKSQFQGVQRPVNYDDIELMILPHVFHICTSAGGCPYNIANHLLFACSMSKIDGSPILKTFGAWLRERDAAEVELTITPEVQLAAFQTAVFKTNSAIRKEMFSLFRLREATVETLVQITRRIRNLADDGTFGVAVEAVSRLKVQNQFNWKELVLPCILQGDVGFVELYVSGLDLSETKQLIRALDDISTSTFDFQQVPEALRAIEISEALVKRVRKLAARLSKAYGVESEAAIELARSRSKAALRSAVESRFVAKTMNESTFNDVIIYGIDKCPELLADFFDLMSNPELCGDRREVTKWANHFADRIKAVPNLQVPNIDQSLEPLEIEISVYEPTNDQRSTYNPGYLQLPLSPSDVVLVADEQALSDALAEIEKAEVVGLDAEFELEFGQALECAAILQVSTANKAYIFDLQTMADEEGGTAIDRRIMKDAMRRLFCKETARKLGFAFNGDVKVLANTLPFCGDELAEISNTVCLSKLVTILVKSNANFVVGTQEQLVEKAAVKYEYGLAELCERLLKLPLDKHEQCSNWSRRPLRWAQLRYAALDAYILIRLFDRLRTRAVELDIDFEDAVQNSMVDGEDAVAIGGRQKHWAFTKNSETDEASGGTTQVGASSSTGKSTTVSEMQRPPVVRVVLCPELKFVGGHLRRCGIDTRMITKDEDWTMTLMASLVEDRFVITTETAEAKGVPKDRLFRVPSKFKRPAAIASWFCNEVQIAIPERGMILRCKECNGPDIVEIDSKLLRVVLEAKAADRATAFDLVRQHVQAGTMKAGGGGEATAVETTAEVKHRIGFKDDRWLVEFIDSSYKLDLSSGEILRDASTGPVLVKFDTMSKMEVGPRDRLFEQNGAFRLCCSCGTLYW